MRAYPLGTYERAIEGVYKRTYHIRTLVMQLHDRNDINVAIQLTQCRVGVVDGTELAWWTLCTVRIGWLNVD